MSELLPIETETTTDGGPIHAEIELVNSELEALRLSQLEAADKLAVEVAPSIEAGKAAEVELEALLAAQPDQDDLNPISRISRDTNGLFDSTEGN